SVWHVPQPLLVKSCAPGPAFAGAAACFFAAPPPQPARSRSATAAASATRRAMRLKIQRVLRGNSGAHDLHWRRQTRPKLERDSALADEDLGTVDGRAAGGAGGGDEGRRPRARGVGEVDDLLAGARLDEELVPDRRRVHEDVRLGAV